MKELIVFGKMVDKVLAYRPKKNNLKKKVRKWKKK
jgi:hypothetical protein